MAILCLLIFQLNDTWQQQITNIKKLLYETAVRAGQLRKCMHKLASFDKTVNKCMVELVE